MRPAAIRLGGGVALTAGTRAFLAPTQVSRILDLHLRTGVGLFSLSARELRGSTERTHGYGASVHGVRAGPVELHLEGESWREPRAPEGATERDGWHLGAEADWQVTGTLGLSLRAGRKSAGVLPGLPLDAGSYVGFGLLYAR